MGPTITLCPTANRLEGEWDRLPSLPARPRRPILPLLAADRHNLEFIKESLLSCFIRTQIRRRSRYSCRWSTRTRRVLIDELTAASPVIVRSMPRNIKSISDHFSCRHHPMRLRQFSGRCDADRTCMLRWARREALSKSFGDRSEHVFQSRQRVGAVVSGTGLLRPIGAVFPTIARYGYCLSVNFGSGWIAVIRWSVHKGEVRARGAVREPRRLTG